MERLLELLLVLPSRCRAAAHQVQGSRVVVRLVVRRGSQEAVHRGSQVVAHRDSQEAVHGGSQEAVHQGIQEAVRHDSQEAAPPSAEEALQRSRVVALVDHQGHLVSSQEVVHDGQEVHSQEEAPSNLEVAVCPLVAGHLVVVRHRVLGSPVLCQGRQRDVAGAS